VQLFLGVDGGGTKTHVVLVDEKRRVVGSAFTGASNPLRVGIETAVQNVMLGVIAACDTAGRTRAEIVSAVIGLAGVRREDLRDRLRERFVQLLLNRNVRVMTDAEIALFSIGHDSAGIVVIAGTGSICVGQNDDGETSTAGGWGPLAGDEGGGAGIARRALQAIAKASDGRAPKTKLTEVAMRYFRASTPEDLVVAIYAPQVDNAKIAGFAREVVETAKRGDKIAREVLNEAARELALAARVVVANLSLGKKAFPIIRVGGIFKAGDLISKPFLKSVKEIAPKAFFRDAEFSPAVAAALMAKESSGL